MNEDAVKVRRALRSALAGLGLAVIVACGGASQGAESSAPDEEAVMLAAQDVALAQRANIGGSVVLTGTLQPYRIAEVRAQVPGTITDIGAEAGDAVRDGEILARIQAQGIVSQAAGAEANLALARRQLESARTLYEAGAMSEIDFRTAQTAYEAARAQAATAAEAASHTSVRAPFPGEVSDRIVELGEAVNPGQALFTVVNTDFLELVGQIPVDQVAQVREGQPVEFTLTAYPEQVLRGEVARVEPTADPATRQVGVYVRLPNRERGLIGGLFATGRIQTGEAQEDVVVPVGAVRESGANTYVWTVEDGVVHQQAVTTGARDETRGVVAITSGLSGGEQVVVAPGELEEGTRVRLAAGNDNDNPANASDTASASDTAGEEG